MKDWTSTRAKVLADLDVSPGRFVVEVGGGHEPFGRSDLILDKYPFDELHRSQALVHAAPVVIADALRIPIRDGGCDLLFASHIIEHVLDPDRFLREVRRCAARAYIEFPGPNRELMFAWAMHAWLVIPEGRHLRFYRNDIPQLFGDFFHANYDFILDAWAEQRHDSLNRHVYCDPADLSWEIMDSGACEFLVRGSARGAERIDICEARPVRYTWSQIASIMFTKVTPRSLQERIVEGVRRRRRSKPQPLTSELVARMMCPACGSTDLQLGPTEIGCGGCSRVYRRRGGLFDLDVIGDGSEPR